jgi:hypothetical protein
MFLGKLRNIFTNKRFTTPWTMKDLNKIKREKGLQKQRIGYQKVLKHCNILKFQCTFACQNLHVF